MEEFIQKLLSKIMCLGQLATEFFKVFFVCLFGGFFLFVFLLFTIEPIFILLKNTSTDQDYLSKQLNWNCLLFCYKAFLYNYILFLYAVIGDGNCLFLFK